jgi:predicted DsbA family dithiol-disulfide isomerase
MALANFPERESVRVIWRSFELDPDAPQQHPEKLVEMLARKYGVSPQQAAEMNVRVTRLAKEIGLEYRLSNARPGNTFDAHRLLHFATSLQLGNQATERIMHAYFCEELAVGDCTALARLAPEFGIKESDVLSILDSNAYSEEVRADEARASKFGVAGIPFFLFDEKTSVSGAQSVEIFADALQQARSDL